MTETIRRAGSGDAQILAHLSRETFTAAFGSNYDPAELAAFVDKTYDPERLRRDLADPGVAFWLLEADGTAVGYAMAGPNSLSHPLATPACGELKRLYLLPGWQGGGRGSRLMETALAWLERDGPRPVWIGVFSENTGALRLYARHGFAKVGEHVFVVGRHRDREFTLRRA